MLCPLVGPVPPRKETTSPVFGENSIKPEDSVFPRGLPLLPFWWGLLTSSPSSLFFWRVFKAIKQSLWALTFSPSAHLLKVEGILKKQITMSTYFSWSTCSRALLSCRLTPKSLRGGGSTGDLCLCAQITAA